MSLPAWLEQLFEWIVQYIKNNQGVSLMEMMDENFVTFMDEYLDDQDNNYEFLNEKFNEIETAKSKEEALNGLNGIVEQYGESEPKIKELKQLVEDRVDKKFEAELAMPETTTTLGEVQEAVPINLQEEVGPFNEQELTAKLMSLFNGQEVPTCKEVDAFLKQLESYEETHKEALTEWGNKYIENGPDLFHIVDLVAQRATSLGADKDEPQYANLVQRARQLEPAPQIARPLTKKGDGEQETLGNDSSEIQFVTTMDLLKDAWEDAWGFDCDDTDSDPDYVLENDEIYEFIRLFKEVAEYGFELEKNELRTWMSTRKMSIERMGVLCENTNDPGLNELKSLEGLLNQRPRPPMPPSLTTLVGSLQLQSQLARVMVQSIGQQLDSGNVSLTQMDAAFMSALKRVHPDKKAALQRSYEEHTRDYRQGSFQLDHKEQIKANYTARLKGLVKLKSKSEEEGFSKDQYYAELKSLIKDMYQLNQDNPVNEWLKQNSEIDGQSFSNNTIIDTFLINTEILDEEECDNLNRMINNKARRLDSWRQDQGAPRPQGETHEKTIELDNLLSNLLELQDKESPDQNDKREFHEGLQKLLELSYAQENNGRDLEWAQNHKATIDMLIQSDMLEQTQAYALTDKQIELSNDFDNWKQREELVNSGQSTLRMSNQGAELEAVQPNQQPRREPTPNEIIADLNMGCRKLDGDQFETFNDSFNPQNPEDFFNKLSDVLTEVNMESDIKGNFKGHHIDGLAKHSELAMLGAKQRVITLRNTYGENRDQHEQANIERALGVYQQAEQVHDFIRSVRYMARADTMMHEDVANERLNKIFGETPESPEAAALKQRLLEISQNVKHKHVYQPPENKIGYSQPKEKGFGKKRHIVYDDETGQPKVGNHSNYTLRVNQDGHVQARVFFDINQYRDKGEITELNKHQNKHVARLDKTVSQMVSAAINEAGLGAPDKPFEIKLFDPKNYELALIALTKIKERAMLDGKDYHIKVPDPNQPGNTKTIKITPERGVSDDFKAYFSHMAQQKSDIGKGRQAKHCAGHYFINNENTKHEAFKPERYKSGRYYRYKDAKPEEYGDIFAKHMENRFDKLHNHCNKRVEAASEIQSNIEVKQEKRSRNRLN